MSSGSSVARFYAIIPRMDSSYRMYGKMEYFQEEDGVVKIIVEPIYFDYNKWDITPKAIVELEKVLKVMREFPDVKIKIESQINKCNNNTTTLNIKKKI